MYRRAYVLLIGIAVTMGTLAIVTSQAIDRPLADPEGFLGPSWLRLPLLLTGAFLADMLPRVLWFSRGNPNKWRDIVAERWRSHWTRERLTLVVLGLVCFYVTYVSYRNLKSFLPFVRGERKYDRELDLIDQALFLGHEPALVLQDVLGTQVTAHFLSTIYLWFLPLVPLALTAWLIWSRNISYGYWFATSQCIAWSLGTLSYYVLPTLGPGFYKPWLYEELSPTATTALMDGLSGARERVIWQGVENAVQSTAGFASLHVAITLLVALMIQYTLHSRVRALGLLGQLRPHRLRHPLLRLALRRRRRRRHPDRAAGVLPGRPGERAGVRTTWPGLAPHDGHLGGARRGRPPLTVP